MALTLDEKKRIAIDAFNDAMGKGSEYLTVSKCTGKMEGIPSISTNLYLCDGCKKRNACRNMVCHYCYATSMQWANAWKAFARNTAILSKPITADCIKKLTKDLKRQSKDKSIPLCRLLTHGDLPNFDALLNFFAIAKAFPKTKFSLMTKEEEIVKKASQMMDNGELVKPENLKVVFSSYNVNVPYKKALDYSLVDEIYTVFAKDYIEEKGLPKGTVSCHCGPASCFNCKQCYLKDNAFREVGETLRV